MKKSLKSLIAGASLLGVIGLANNFSKIDNQREELQQTNDYSASETNEVYSASSNQLFRSSAKSFITPAEPAEKYHAGEIMTNWVDNANNLNFRFYVPDANEAYVVESKTNLVEGADWKTELVFPAGSTRRDYIEVAFPTSEEKVKFFRSRKL